MSRGNARELAVLFADVSGSARLYEKLGNTEALYAVDRCIKRMERSVEGFRGCIIKVDGDEIMAVFVSPEDAFHAATDMQQRIADLPPVSGVKLGIRIGFHFGMVVEDKADCSGEAVGVAAHLAGLAKAGQTLTSGETVARLPELQQLATRRIDPSSATEKKQGGLQVFEVLWLAGDEAGEATTGQPAAATGASSARLRLRHADKVVVLDAATPRLTLGRDVSSGLQVRDRRASRNHGRIELHGDKFILSDASTNGTYVTMSGEPEVFLRRKEIVLRGSGLISFAASAASEAADVAEFEHL